MKGELKSNSELIALAYLFAATVDRSPELTSDSPSIIRGANIRVYSCKYNKKIEKTKTYTKKTLQA